MNAGDLNRRATLMELIDTPDGSGGFTRVWSELGGSGNGGVWIKADPGGGNTSIEANINRDSQSWSFVIRFRSDVNATMRIDADWLPSGFSLAIDSVFDRDGKRHWLHGTGTASAF